MPNPAKTADAPASAYDEDFSLWAERQAALLRAGDYGALDVDNLIEAIEEIPRSDKRATESNLVVVLKHLLKYQFQPEKRTGSWRSTIREHRRRVLDSLEDSPSLRPKLLARYHVLYRNARQQAADETYLSVSRFPEDPEFDLDTALDGDFWPGAVED